MTELLLSSTTKGDSRELYNHYDAVARGFPDKVDARNENNPDLVLLIGGFGGEVSRTRQQYADYIDSDPGIKQMFYDRLPAADVHSTIQRVDLFANVPPEKIDELINRLRQGYADVGSLNLLYGEKWIVGDALISELTTETGDDPVRLVREIACEALEATGFKIPRPAKFTSHSSDRYARALDKSRQEAIRVFLESANIEPAEFTVPGIFVAVNWPERDDAKNYGTYKHKVIEFIPFADVDEETELSMMRKERKLVLPSREM